MQHIEFHVEEESMRALLDVLLPRIAPSLSFKVYAYQGKPDMLRKLKNRMLGYKRWLPEYYKIFILIDRDKDDCTALKQELENIASLSGLNTKTRSGSSDCSWQVVNRIVIEELEAWYFGDWEAVINAYPEAAPKPRRQVANPDGLSDTWEQFERIMKRKGYFKSGLRKIEAARNIGAYIEPERQKSPSFIAFYDAIKRIVDCDV